MVPPYPLLLTPIPMKKPWGGDRLRRWGKSIAPGVKVGESWEVADLASTSASGAGGGAARSVIRNGALAGATIADAALRWGPALGVHAGAYPLLIKFLDARENLSVQVHPSPAYLRNHPASGAHLKTECWYILEAEPGSVIYKGVKAGVSPDRFRAAIADGSVVSLLGTVHAIPGQCHNLPSGTVHALGAGVVVAEVQTPSDTTFRVFDWDRKDRELHIEDAMECIEFAPAPEAVDLAAGRELATEFFRIRLVRTPATINGPSAVTVLQGTGSVHGEALAVGDSAVLPAGGWAFQGAMTVLAASLR